MKFLLGLSCLAEGLRVPVFHCCLKVLVLLVPAQENQNFLHLSCSQLLSDSFPAPNELNSRMRLMMDGNWRGNSFQTGRQQLCPEAQEGMWVGTRLKMLFFLVFFFFFFLELTGFWWWFVFRPWRTFGTRALWPVRQVRSAGQSCSDVGHVTQRSEGDASEWLMF